MGQKTNSFLRPLMINQLWVGSSRGCTHRCCSQWMSQNRRSAALSVNRTRSSVLVRDPRKVILVIVGTFLSGAVVSWQQHKAAPDGKFVLCTISLTWEHYSQFQMSLGLVVLGVFNSEVSQHHLHPFSFAHSSLVSPSSQCHFRGGAETLPHRRERAQG